MFSVTWLVNGLAGIWSQICTIRKSTLLTIHTQLLCSYLFSNYGATPYSHLIFSFKLIFFNLAEFQYIGVLNSLVHMLILTNQIFHFLYSRDSCGFQLILLGSTLPSFFPTLYPSSLPDCLPCGLPALASEKKQPSRDYLVSLYCCIWLNPVTRNI